MALLAASKGIEFDRRFIALLRSFFLLFWCGKERGSWRGKSAVAIVVVSSSDGGGGVEHPLMVTRGGITILRRDAMVGAEAMTGVDGHRVFALPHDRLRDILKKYNRLR